MSEFGMRLRMLRKEKDLTLAELSAKLNTTRSNLSRWENGIVDPSLDVVIDIAKHFNVTLDWIAGNGERNDIEYAKNNKYADIVDKCVRDGIDPDKLEKLIDVIGR